MRIKPKEPIERKGAYVKDLSGAETEASTEIYYVMEERHPKYGWLPVPLRENARDETSAQKALDARRIQSYWVNRVRVCRITREVTSVLTKDRATLKIRRKTRPNR